MILELLEHLKHTLIVFEDWSKVADCELGNAIDDKIVDMVAGKDLFILDLGYHNLLFEGIENKQLILVYLLQI